MTQKTIYVTMVADLFHYCHISLLKRANEIKKGALSKWAMPDKIEYVKEIEKTSVGKINKKLLREKYKFINTNEK